MVNSIPFAESLVIDTILKYYNGLMQSTYLSHTSSSSSIIKIDKILFILFRPLLMKQFYINYNIFVADSHHKLTYFNKYFVKNLTNSNENQWKPTKTNKKV